MWLVSSPSPLLSRRDAVTGPGLIDAFFDTWLPTIVDEVRRLAKGPQYAAARHQGVISKDGLSRPAAAIGTQHYLGGGTEGEEGDGGRRAGGEDPPPPALIELQASADAAAAAEMAAANGKRKNEEEREPGEGEEGGGGTGKTP